MRASARQRNIRRFYAAIFSASLLIIIAFHQFVPPNLSHTAKELLLSLHAPGFALVTWITLWMFVYNGRGLSSYPLAGAIAMTVAVIAEASQIPGPRNAEFSDLVADAIGIISALGVAALFDRQLASRVGWRQRLAGVAFVLIAVFLTFRTSVELGNALYARNSAFPELLMFEERWEEMLYTESLAGTARIAPNPDGWPDTGGKSVLWAEAAGRWGIFIHFYPYPDWRNFNELTFLAASTDDNTYPITITVLDTGPAERDHGNRFRTSIEIGPQAVRYAIPFAELEGSENGRSLDLAHIEAVIVSGSRQKRPSHLVLDDVRLR